MTEKKPCQCDRCMKKTPSEGFWHASRAAHTRDEDERRELDYWMEQQIGYDPKIGRPSLDNVFERQRTPEDLQRVLAGVRKRYPRAFNKNKLEWDIERAPIPYVESPPELVAERMEALERRLPRTKDEEAVG